MKRLLALFATAALLAAPIHAEAARLQVSNFAAGACNQNGAWQACPLDNVTPSQATAAGYTTLTFSSNNQFNTSTVDMGKTYSSGFKWYLDNYFGANTDPSAATLNPDGSVSLTGTHSNDQLSSAAAKAGSPYFVGEAFGCGAYFEATLKFTPRDVNNAFGWPSWWTMAIEHLDGSGNDQWPGQGAGYYHFGEVDIFEYSKYQPDYYATVHDWYGTMSCTGSFLCDVSNAPQSLVPVSNIDWTKYHKYGVLWVPATASTQGSLTWYLDGVAMLTQSYAQYTNQSPPPAYPATNWTFGIIDQEHLALIIGSGTNTPINVRSVNVWQGSGACNVSN